MHVWRRAYLGSLLALGLSGAGAFAADIPAPVVKPELLQKISARVHVIPDEGRRLVPNAGFVVGETGVLVVDTGIGPSEGAKIAAVAAKLGGTRQIYLVTTHVHPEHDLGAQGFPAAVKMIRSQAQVKEIAEVGLRQAEQFSQNFPVVAPMLKDARFRAADITFETEYMLDLGGLRVRIMAVGPNHTPGDTVAWIEAERVLFSGDVAMKPQPSINGDGARLTHWMETLDKLAALKPAIVVPSHGPIGDAGFIDGYKKYFGEVRERVLAEKRAGRGADEAVKTVGDAMAPRFQDRGRLDGVIRAAIAEK